MDKLMCTFNSLTADYKLREKADIIGTLRNRYFSMSYFWKHVFPNVNMTFWHMQYVIWQLCMCY